MSARSLSHCSVIDSSRNFSHVRPSMQRRVCLDLLECRHSNGSLFALELLLFLSKRDHPGSPTQHAVFIYFSGGHVFYFSLCIMRRRPRFFLLLYAERATSNNSEDKLIVARCSARAPLPVGVAPAVLLVVAGSSGRTTRSKATKRNTGRARDSQIWEFCTHQDVQMFDRTRVPMLLHWASRKTCNELRFRQKYL